MPQTPHINLASPSGDNGKLEMAGTGLGENKLVCFYSIFKQHVRLSFSQRAYLADEAKILMEGESNAPMRSIKFTDSSQVDKGILQRYVSEAAQLAPSTTLKPAWELTLPPDLVELLTQYEPTYTTFQKLSSPHRKEFAVWLKGAKRPETRMRRRQQIVAQLTKKSKILPK